jgi:N6-adenosine-specific RNA methylase IME4
MIDPPWNETGGAAKSKAFGAGPRGADQHYPLLKTPEIPPAILASGMFNLTPDSHLYLWVTNNFMEDGIWVMNQLGFRLIQKIEWVKAPRVPVWIEPKPGVIVQPVGGRLVYPDRDFGLGRYFRGKTETCLFGVRGAGLSVCTPAKNVTNLIVAPKTRHSRKPPEAYLKVEERTLPPFLEMFGRGSFGRANWDIHGNESI